MTIVGEHFNSLSPAEAERLAMLAEEAGEIVQAVGKVLRHGYESYHPDGGPTNRRALAREVIDLLAIVAEMPELGDLDHFAPAIWEQKLRYTHHQVPA